MHLSKVKVYLAGICSLIVTIGVARFSYTSLLPLMKAEAGVSEVVGGWLATSNYLGYMCGVILAASLNKLSYKFALYRLYLLLTVLCTAAMVLTTDTMIWSILRFISGLCSSAGLIIASGLILKWLVVNHHRAELGVHFSGVGISILLTALVVELLFFLALNWQGQWLAFALLAALFSVPAWLWMPNPKFAKTSTGPMDSKSKTLPKKSILIMLSAYFCAGYGYVVSATFIVDIIEKVPSLEGRGQWVFALVGLTAIPAVLIWDRIARRIGYLRSLFLAYVIQALGIILPTVSDQMAVMVLSACLFGGTFVACVSLVLTMAGHMLPSNPAKLMGKMTIAYGVAQIIAPTVTGLLVESFGNYNVGLYLSATVVCLGALFLLMLIKYENQQPRILV